MSEKAFFGFLQGGTSQVVFVGLQLQLKLVRYICHKLQHKPNTYWNFMQPLTWMFVGPIPSKSNNQSTYSFRLALNNVVGQIPT